MAVQFFSHVGLCVTDLARSVRFYRDAMGFCPLTSIQVGSEVGPLMGMSDPNIVLHSRFLERDGARLELLWYETPAVVGAPEVRAMNRPGLTHFAVRVDSVAETLKQVEALGGRTLESSRVGDPVSGVELIYVVDPDGIRIELIQLPGDPTIPSGQPWSGD